MTNISNLKRNFAQKFPASPVSKILIAEPDELSPEEFLVLARALLAIVEEKK